MTTHPWRLMQALFIDVLQFSPLNMLLTLSLMLFRSITAGVSLLLILPLLQVIGFSVGPNQAHGVEKTVAAVFHVLHLPLNLLTMLIIYVLVVCFIAMAAFIEQIISTKLQQHYIHHLRAYLYKQLLYIKWPFFMKQKIPNLLHCLTTQIQMISASNFQLLILLNNAIMLCVYTSMALLLSWEMTMIAVTCACLLLGIMLPLHRLTSQSGRYHLEQNHTIFQSITEQLSALKMIKGSGCEEKFANDIRCISLSLESQNRYLIFVTAATKLLYSVGSVLIFSILLYIAIGVLAVPLESLLLLLVVFSRLLPMVSNIQQNYQRILHQLPAYSEVKQLLQECAENQEHLDAEVPVLNKEISLNSLSFSYHPTQPILSNVSLTIKKNTTTAIMGPSGAGKSTLADLITGLLEPTLGTICIDSHVLDATNKLAWRQSVAYVTQDVFLFNASIRDNLQLFCSKSSDDSLWTALKSAAADGFVASLEQGLDTVVGDRGIRLSGGECQRIALARALLSNPQLLVLDESTSSLDKQNMIKIQQALIQLRGKMTILIISHQTEMSQFADQSIFLAQ
jgi:ATP-binding cassette subfamily C protein